MLLITIPSFADNAHIELLRLFCQHINFSLIEPYYIKGIVPSFSMYILPFWGLKWSQIIWIIKQSNNMRLDNHTLKIVENKRNVDSQSHGCHHFGEFWEHKNLNFIIIFSFSTSENIEHYGTEKGEIILKCVDCLISIKIKRDNRQNS